MKPGDLASEQILVVLLHGLRMPRQVMSLLAGRLRRRAFRTLVLGYPSAERDYEANVGLVVRKLAALTAHRIALVGHSYGGVIALAALARARDPRVSRVVLLASPVRGSEAGVRVTQGAFGRWFVGASHAVWRQHPQLTIPPGVEVGAIAGTRRLGLTRLLVTLRGPNDGVVTVDETRLTGLADHLAVPVGHSFMLTSPAVADQVAHFLRQGRFAR